MHRDEYLTDELDMPEMMQLLSNAAVFILGLIAFGKTRLVVTNFYPFNKAILIVL